MKNRFRILLPLASFAAALTSLPAAAAGKEELVEIDTTLGNIVVRLAPDRAPITVKNFLTYVREGFYKDTISPSDSGIHDSGGRLYRAAS